ncbi:MAG: GAF domain-containing protein, partial [Chloroflexaceae bacterium]|nr:GAF domain-containing protein [Chloroflexaceae bacterium]
RSKPSIKELEQQRVLLQRQRDRDQQALQTLYAISLACRGVTSFQTLFQAIVRELTQVFTFDACYIAVCDPDRPDLFQAVLFEDEGMQEYKEAVERGPLTGLLVQKRGPLLFRDLVAERNRLDKTPDTFGQSHKLSRAWLGVPLMLGDDAIGVVSIQSYTPGVFGEADLDLLQQVANVVAVALENVRLAQAQAALGTALSEQVDARTRELVALSTIAGDMVLREPLPRLLNRALGLMLTLLRLDAGNMRLLDRERNSLVLLVHQGFSEPYAQQRAVLSLTNSLIRGVVLENRPMVVITRLGRMSGSDALASFEALLSVPLRIGSRVLGTLSLFALQPREFDEQERNLAQAVANQAAIAIEIDRLFEERERQIGELRALSAVSHAASTAFDLPSLLRQVHNALQTFMRLDAFSMVIYDPARNIISNGLSIDEGEEYTYWRNEPPPPGSLSAWVIRHRSILQFHNLPEELDSYPELSRHIVGAERHAVSWLGVPLVDRDEAVIGLIALQSYSRAAFSERDVTLLTNIARQVTLHVQNVRLLDQRARQIRELDAIGQIGQLISASYELEEMLEGVYRILNQQLGVVVFYLVICEIETHAITHSVFINQGQRTSPLVPGSPPNPGSLTSWILQHREPLHFHNYPEQQVIAPGGQPCESGRAKGAPAGRTRAAGAGK